MSFPIKCYDCGHAFDTMRVTAALKCARCGSDDIDLDEKTAASPGTGWTETRPDRLQGWNDYAGPLPGANPYASQNNVGDNTTKCQACGGTGVDLRASGGGYNEIPCRNCHGTGQQATHATSPGGTNDASSSGPPVGGSRFQAGRRSSDPLGSADDYIRGTDPDYDKRSDSPWGKADTRQPDVKYRTSDAYAKPHVNKPLPLNGARCPSCGSGATSLVRDENDNAWWHCQNCGSLANIDKNPDINPYSPGEGFTPDRSFGEKKKKSAFRRKKETVVPGKALKMVRATIQTNPGLSVSEALTLVRNALAKYPEN